MSRAQAEKLAAEDPWMASALQPHLRREPEAWEMSE